jgi:superfamily I DNA/RNA helicase
MVESAAEIHSFDISNEETKEPLRRLADLTADFPGDLKAFLDLLSMGRGIDHETLAGDRVALMSLHAAKGLEWPVVFITGCEEGLLPCTIFGERDDEEEKRLFYVGMTRARKWIILSHAKSRILSGRTLQANPSPFLTLIPDGLWAPLARPEWKPRKKTNRQLDLF